MDKLKYAILIITAVCISACDVLEDDYDADDVSKYKYGNYEDSPVKSVNITPQFAPLVVSDGSLVTISYSDKTYSFVKIFADGSTESTPLSFTWSESNSFNPGQLPGGFPDDENSQIVSNVTTNTDVLNATQNADVDLLEGTLFKNCNDEYYYSYYSTNTFGRNYYAVVKFDKDCNIVFKIDSTVTAMGGGPMGGGSTTTTKQAVAGTPLNNGGYAMLLQASTMGMVQNSDYNLTLRIIDTEGKVAADYTLEFSEQISITSVLNVNNNIAVYYQLSDQTKYINLYTQNGILLGTLPSDDTQDIYTYIIYGESVIISGYDKTSQKFFLKQLDQYGNTQKDSTLDVSAVIYNITEFDGKRCYSGVLQTTFDPSNYDSDNYIDYITNSDGFIFFSDNNEIDKPIRADYNNGVIIFATFKNDDGTYTVYLSQISPLATLASRLGDQMYVYRTVASRLCDKIYIYRTDDLKKLEVN